MLSHNKPHGSLFSSVVEHWSRKPGVMGSIPIGGIFCQKRLTFLFKLKHISQSAGFEPARAEPIGFQVQRLNHSATTAHIVHTDVWLANDKHLTNTESKKVVEMRGIEPRAFHMQSERSTTELHPLGLLPMRIHHKWQNTSSSLRLLPATIR